jgi:hypothetical protein
MFYFDRARVLNTSFGLHYAKYQHEKYKNITSLYATFA